jgi:hypothetical protein
MEHASNYLSRLLDIIAEAAAGRYSGRVMGLTGPETAEPVRTIAEAIGLMMVTLEAREHQLEELLTQLQSANSQIRENIIAAVDEKTTALKEKFTKWGTAEDAFKFWAERLRAFFDQVHAESLP